jgi:hypothetical protein
MTFELSSDQAAARDRARGLAQNLRAQAGTVDQSGSLPADTVRDLGAMLSGDHLTTIVVLEEIAAVLPAAAVSALAGSLGAPLPMTGLRGAAAPDDSPRTQLGLAATALGIGRAAMDAALAEIRQAQGAAAAGEEKPQWVVADVATELDAARLLTFKAGESGADADIALARLMASGAAQRAVDAALRIIGVAALNEGHAVERLARDARAVALLLGNEEQQRSVAAETLLPR